ncbi:Gfo/Idh/MocA family protein [Pontibacter beigongshangensis]|uniref:Gfo/Idh/MocA family protein n=1 Tax=Pontibacter beigongshangensis TaxID=2574733 RepID=UPI00164F13CB|nr:Gfo/Idh/MocA family oxidoreductase [Pontibacter beigongshangensis]
MKMNWGILGAAKIALEKVIPAMAGRPDFQVYGIASRNVEKARAAAEKLDIPKVYGSYEELIADPDIHIVYNPLPNHLHAEYTLKCIEAGKHVLCEKPIALSSQDVKRLIAARDRHQVKVGEAFMVRSHPQWHKTRELVQQGALGKIKLVQGSFSYFNVTPGNIRNIAAYGGGAMWDIGCYPVTICRYVLGEEPIRVIGLMETDPGFGTDKLTSVVMQFPSAQVAFSVSTQLVPYQRMHFFGENQELEVQIPFNAPNDTACEIKINHGDILQEQVKTISFAVCDQYTLMAAAFTKAVRENTEVPVTLEDALANTRVIEAIFQSAREHRWVNLQELS